MSQLKTSPPSRAGRLLHGARMAFEIVRHYPILVPLGIITLFAESIYSGLNNVTLFQYVGQLGATPENQAIIVGWVSATFLLAETFLRLPFGWISDRWGRAKVVIAALFLAVPSFLAGSMVHSYLWLFPLRWWDGMMAAALWPSLFALVGDTVPARARANAMGAINMMYMLGLLGGGGMGAVLLQITGSPRTYFVFAGIVMAIGGVLAISFFRLRPQLSAPHAEVHLEDEEHAVLSVARHVPLLIITFVQNFAILILAPYMFAYLNGPHDLGFPLQKLALLVGVPVLAIALLALPLSRIGDVVGKITVVRVAFTAIAIALWLFTVNTTLLGLLPIITVIGVAFATGIPAWLAIITSLSGRKTRGVTYAAYGTVQGLAAVCGPIAGGYIWSKLGHSAIFMASAAAVSLAAILCWTTLPEHRHTQNSAKPV